MGAALVADRLLSGPRVRAAVDGARYCTHASERALKPSGLERLLLLPRVLAHAALQPALAGMVDQRLLAWLQTSTAWSRRRAAMQAWEAAQGE